MYAKKLYNEEWKRFVTEEEAAAIDAANKEHYRQKRIAQLQQLVKDAQKSKDKYQELTARAQLEAELGNRDTAWRYFNEAVRETMKKGQVGGYRNLALDMAMFLKKEGRYKHALSLLSEVCYLDYCHYSSDPELYRHFGFIFAPGVLREIRLAMRRGDIDPPAFREIFMSVAQRSPTMKAQYPPMDAWKALEEELQDCDLGPNSPTDSP